MSISLYNRGTLLLVCALHLQSCSATQQADFLGAGRSMYHLAEVSNQTAQDAYDQIETLEAEAKSSTARGDEKLLQPNFLISGNRHIRRDDLVRVGMDIAIETTRSFNKSPNLDDYNNARRLFGDYLLPLIGQTQSKAPTPELVRQVLERIVEIDGRLESRDVEDFIYNYENFPESQAYLDQASELNLHRDRPRKEIFDFFPQRILEDLPKKYGYISYYGIAERNYKETSDAIGPNLTEYFTTAKRVLASKYKVTGKSSSSGTASGGGSSGPTFVVPPSVNSGSSCPSASSLNVEVVASELVPEPTGGSHIAHVSVANRSNYDCVVSVNATYIYVSNTPIPISSKGTVVPAHSQTNLVFDLSLYTGMVQGVTAHFTGDIDISYRPVCSGN